MKHPVHQAARVPHSFYPTFTRLSTLSFSLRPRRTSTFYLPSTVAPTSATFLYLSSQRLQAFRSYSHFYPPSSFPFLFLSLSSVLSHYTSTIFIALSLEILAFLDRTLNLPRGSFALLRTNHPIVCSFLLERRRSLYSSILQLRVARYARCLVFITESSAALVPGVSSSTWGSDTNFAMFN